MNCNQCSVCCQHHHLGHTVPPRKQQANCIRSKCSTAGLLSTAAQDGDKSFHLDINLHLAFRVHVFTVWTPISANVKVIIRSNFLQIETSFFKMKTQYLNYKNMYIQKHWGGRKHLADPNGYHEVSFRRGLQIVFDTSFGGIVSRACEGIHLGLLSFLLVHMRNVLIILETVSSFSNSNSLFILNTLYWQKWASTVKCNIPGEIFKPILFLHRW